MRANSALAQRNQAQNAARLERAVMDRDGTLVRYLVHAESALLTHQTQARAHWFLHAFCLLRICEQ